MTMAAIRHWWLSGVLLGAGCAPLDVPPPVAAPPPPASEAEAPVPPPPPKPRQKPESLLGLGPADTLLLLGTPDLVRRDDSVQIHQYRDTLCVLDLIFYEGADHGPFRLSAVDSRDRAAQPYDGADCLERLIQRRP